MLSFKFLTILCVAMAVNGLASTNRPQTTTKTAGTNRPQTTRATTGTNRPQTTRATTGTNRPQTTRATTSTKRPQTPTTPYPHIDSSTLKWQGLLAVINPQNKAYCLTYQSLKAGTKLTFAPCNNASSAQQWVTAQLWNATDAPWNACLLDNINLCDSVDSQGQGVLAATKLSDKKQHWYYNWTSNQYNNGGVPASKCSEVILGSDKTTPIGAIFKPCNSGIKLQKWYFPYYNLPLAPWNSTN